MPSINLSSCPAFGFETANCNANKARVAKCSTSDPRVVAAKKNLIEKTYYKAANVFKVLGYVCPLVGAVRIVTALTGNDANKMHHVARGAAELFGLGLFLFAADVAVTLHRDYVARQATVVTI